MKYLFILGRNIELSIAEIISYLENNNYLKRAIFSTTKTSEKQNKFSEKESNQISKYTVNNNSILIEVERKIEENAIDKFGGVIAIGEVISSGDISKILDELEKRELYYGVKNKFNYVLWDFSDRTADISNYLKRRFKSEKLKATEKKLTGSIKLQTGKQVQNISSSLIDEEYFLFNDSKINNQYFGKIIQNCDYEKIEKRDMHKPVRREALSISPRLAKIMINLSQVKSEGILVDPFCGIGVVLQEALIHGVKVIGIDKDAQAISGAEMNLKWMGFSKKNYQLINGDSRIVSINQSDVIVTEPDLGELLTKIPTKEKAERMIREFEKLMVEVLNNLKNKISGRIVFTAPLIKIEKRRVSCSIDNILNKTGLKLVKGFPIPEFREEQIVGRNIFVLEH